ncbi:methyltransferase [Nocardia goodfellowii]|uniref:SAM-dependent methyltransferase n=1 Tax=Nocardia goodfellowii TaxID=882446 RepID=A0ABS4QH92_9NOCA|nr:class I SAM-dependent methyltransferase [Nocardia goodfellowii]MBP2191056.1 SAM-dependent methyltransferase [Nocardia goodfellowii]
MPTIRWTENGSARTAPWHSENAAPPPAEVVVVDDRTTAKSAYRLARAGTGLLWRGDFHNARQLMRAMERLFDRRRRKAPVGDDPATLFLAHRAERAERADLLGKLLVRLEPDHSLDLRRAPDVRAACAHAYGSAAGEMCVSLPELLGVLSAYQWHQKGVEVAALGARVFPDYGVFSPIRGEYIDLVARAPWPTGVAEPRVFDLGTGTGVLAAVLARRGAQVVATDINRRAVACARTNSDRLGLADRVRVVEADLWTSGRADVVLCNPPWIPARPTSDLELGVYDADSGMLHRFLDGLTEHLTPRGEGWLVLSDLAEHLGLRTRAELLARIDNAGLRIVARDDTSPRHPRAADVTDPLHAARSQEVTSLWRLAAQN